MQTREQKMEKKGRSNFLWIGLILLLILVSGFGESYKAHANWNPPTRYQSENGFNSGVSTSSANAGYSGSGYITGITTTSSETKFDRGTNSLTLVKLDIRYANGTASNITNLALYIGSNQKIQDLVLPPTGSWSTWATLTVTFNQDPSWGSNIIIKSTANVSTSANLDYVDYFFDDGQGIPTVVAPTFSPVAGTYTSTQSVTLSTTTSGATIYYTTDGSTPTTASSVYSATISVASTKTIKALATKSDMSNSSVASALYTINIPTVATPTFSPAGGTYATTQSVTIASATSGATIYYTTDGTTPTTASSVYSTAVSVATSKTLKALAVKSGLTNSAIGSATYTISTTVATPTFSPTGGTYTSEQSVSISTSTSGSTIYYTTDGTTPTTASSVYSTALSVSTSRTLKALAVKSGLSNSAVGSATYTINIAVATPTFSPAGGTYSTTQSVSISSATSGSTIHYTTDGTTPTTASPVYSSAISVAASKTVKALAVKSGLTNSSIGSATYTISSVTSQPGVIRERWTTLAGSTVSDLTSNVNYPNSPTTSAVITTFDAQEFGDSYGQRIKGYLAPTVTGTYKFWIASDDDSELWLSTNDQASNKVKIASMTGWADPYDYNKFGTQASASISLTAGNYYYIEALHKENNGGDHVTVAWQVPGGSRAIITSANLVTSPPIPLPQPGTFSQTAPAGGATGVALSPTFSWGASSDAASYTLVVSSNSSYTSPVINQSGITGTSYAGGGLAGTTTYYWRVTAVNSSGTRVASNAGLSFTTLTPPAPGTFSQTAPASGASSVSRTTTFTWGASANVSSYALVVSTSSSYSNPLINVTGLTSTSYSPATSLAGSTVYYWRVTATNSTSSTIATNAGISFTTAATVGTYYYVSTTGVDAVGRGAAGSPYRTLAYAATHVAPNQNNTIYLNAGTYVETACTLLPLGVNIEGAGESSVTVTANGNLPTPGADQSSADFHLWADGSLIQLKSPIYSGPNPRYNNPSFMIGPVNGNQTLSGFTLDGNSKTVKAGIWVENRNNTTVHHVTFRNFKMHGAIFSRGDMWYYEPLPEGKWMLNTRGYNLTFTNCSSDGIGGATSGNLGIGGLDGADFYNITINENQGYGIKFKHVGHYRNVKVHDCNITVPETDPSWGEDISIEMWDLSYNNEIYNIVCNTWLSLVNHVQFNDYQPTTANPSNLKVRNVRIIDNNGSSGKEAIECALSGVEISDSYIQDKGFGIAIWGGVGESWGGTIPIHDINIHNNIFTNVNRQVEFGFGNSAAVFIADPSNTIKIHNNVFDRLGNSLQMDAGSNVSIKNNTFLNSAGDDVQGGSSLTFTNNLRYHTDATRQNWAVSTAVNATNIKSNPGFKNTGSRWTTYYQPSSAGSAVVNQGVSVGLPANGLPDIGRWEFGLTSFRSEVQIVDEEKAVDDSIIRTYPNPTTGKVKIASTPDVKITGVKVSTLQGKTIFTKSLNGLSNLDVDLSEQSNDVYIFSIKHLGGVITKKVVLLK